jgi:hypothetical protein
MAVSHSLFAVPSMEKSVNRTVDVACQPKSGQLNCGWRVLNVALNADQEAFLATNAANPNNILNALTVVRKQP